MARRFPLPATTGPGLLGFLIGIVALSVLSPAAHAQDLEQWQQLDRYRYLPRLPEGDENPPPLPDRETPVTGSDEVLVDELKGLIFVDNPANIQQGRLDVSGVHIVNDDDLSLMRDAGFQDIANSYLGGPVSIYRLNQLVREIILYYRDNDEPVVDVSVPEQDVTDGVVQVVVTEARAGRVRVQGPCFFKPGQLVKQVCISPGDPIYESTLLEDQRWLMRNPFRDVELELTPGEVRGETDVIFNIYDRRPARFYAGYEDTGNQTTGLERTIWGVNWYNALWRDDQLSYQYTASSDWDRVGVHSGVYSTALVNRDIITVFGSYGEVEVPPIFNPFNNTGRFSQASIRWYRELCPWGCWEHGIQAGFDYKNTNSSLDFGGVLVFANDADILQFMVGYNGKRFDGWGSTHLAADVFMSPGNLSGRNDSASYQAINPFADPSYAYGRGHIERRTWLPYSMEFVVRATGQIAHTNLLPPETLGLGGYNSIRGYDQYTFAGDSGYFINLELWSDPICVLGDDELRVLGFYDFGEGWAHTPVPGLPNNANLEGIGVGARYTYTPNFQLRLDYAWQLDPAVGLPQPESRVHLGAVISY